MLNKRYILGHILVLTISFNASKVEGIIPPWVYGEENEGLAQAFKKMSKCATDRVKNVEKWYESQVEFARVGWKNKNTVGTFFQVSRWAGRELAKHVNPDSWVLEAGAGSGNTTWEIIDRLGILETIPATETIPPRIVVNGRLIAVELLPDLFKILNKTYHNNDDEDPQNRIIYENVDLVEDDVLNVNLPTITGGAEQVQTIVSTIPFNALQPDLVLKILTFFVNNTDNNGWISYIEYPLTWIMKLCDDSAWKQYCEVQAITATFRNYFPHETVRVALNFPPVVMVHHIQITAEGRAQFLAYAQPILSQETQTPYFITMPNKEDDDYWSAEESRDSDGEK